MTTHVKTILSSICLIGVFCATTASAVDQAAAAANLAAVSAISVQANANLSTNALSGDVDGIADWGDRCDALDAVAAQAAEAYARIESELASGNEDEAQSAYDDLKTALENAKNAFGGIIPPINPVDPKDDGKKNSAGGPGRPYDPPNMYDVPWNSQNMRDFYQSHFGNFWMSGIAPRDQEATPE